MTVRSKADFLIVALDVSSFDEAVALEQQLGSAITFYKVGMQLFFAEGDRVITYLKNKNKKVFLDLKLNDIPTTIEKACCSLSKLKPDLLTVYGEAAVVDAAKRGINPECRVLNVTVLTSQLAAQQTSEAVLERTQLTIVGGGDGVICSAYETEAVRKLAGADFLIVNPGIRPMGAAVNDQKRVATPSAALKAGADYIVVGRPITQAPDPAAAASSILKEVL